MYELPFLILLAPFLLLALERMPFARMLSALGWKGISLASLERGIILFAKVILVLMIQGMILQQLGLLDTELVREVIREQGEDFKTFFIIVALVLAPIGEELLFRGYIFQKLAKRASVLAASVFSGGLFAALHFGYGSVAEVSSAFLFSLIVTHEFARTRDIFPVMLAHFLMNLLFLSTM